MENKKSVIGGGICLILVVGLIYNFMILPNKDDIDNTNPIWDEDPMNQIILEGANFSYNVNASDDVAIDKYWINDTTNFQIN